MPYFLTLALALSFAVAQRMETSERHDDIIHSDLPLWTDADETVWPRALHGTGEIGCASRLRYGEWRYDEQDSSNPTWYHMTNYGVLHCFMLVRNSESREALSGREPGPSFLIRLATISGPEGQIQLWAIQRGVRPGSNYILLARRSDSPLIEDFDVLQRECPRHL